MKTTTCDNCKEVIEQEEMDVSYDLNRMFTITEREARSSTTHTMMSTSYKKRFTKHFCSEKCIGDYYKAGEQAITVNVENITGSNVEEISKELYKMAHNRKRTRGKM